MLTDQQIRLYTSLLQVLQNIALECSNSDSFNEFIASKGFFTCCLDELLQEQQHSDSPFLEECWQGYDVYDGGFHYFKRKGNVLVYLDSFGDCSVIFTVCNDEITGVLLRWIATTPEHFKVVALQFISEDEYERFSSDEPISMTDDAAFIEVPYRVASELFNSFFL